MKKRGLNVLLTVVMLITLVTTMCIAASAADGDKVAKVGNTEYDTIDEAVAAWTSTNNSTLTLLSDVTLSDVVKLKSTESHTLDLGTYTVYAASGKNAFEVTSNGGSNSALTVKADATNPGGINAGNKSCIYYKYNSTTASNKEERPSINIYGGVFTGSSTNGIQFVGSATRKAATVNIYGGIFNCGINGQTKSTLIISGGIFNSSVGSQGDVTARRVYSGGTFKSFGFSTVGANAQGNHKFTIGSAQNNFDTGVYINDNGYLVIGGAIITGPEARLPEIQFEASSSYSYWHNYLEYSSAKDNSLYWTSIETAMAKKSTGTFTVHVNRTLDLTGSSFKGTLKLPNADSRLTVTFAEGATPQWSVNTDVAGKVVVYNETVSNGTVTREYYLATPPTANDFTYTAPNELTYDGTEKAATVAVKDGVTGMGSITVKYYKGSELVNGVPKAAGTYTVKIDTEQTATYAAAADLTVGEFTIAQRPITVTWAGNSGFAYFTYDGTEKFPEFTPNGILEGDEVEFVRSGAAIDARHEYLAVINGLTGADADNYTLVGTPTKEFAINKADLEKPVGIGKSDETISKKGDGRITGVTDAMEYRKDGEAVYTQATGDAIENLVPGIYFVRYAETDNYNASDDTEVTVDTGRKMRFTLPQNTVGYTVRTNVLEYDWLADDITVYFELHEGYSKTEDFKYMLNGVEIQLVDGTHYPLSGMSADCVITVEGVADITAPTATIEIKDNKWDKFWSDITFGLIYNKKQEAIITAEDAGSGISTVAYYFADEELTEDALKAVTDWTAYSEKIEISPNNSYIIYAKATDKAGNVVYINSDGVVLDDVAPTLDGIENGKTYYGDLVVIKPEEQFYTFKSVTLDGEEMGFAEGTYGLIQADNKEHTVIATDHAGNSTTYVVTVMKNYTVTFKADGKEIATVTVGHGKDATLPSIPEKIGYTETAPKWNHDGKNITADTVINAAYTKNEPGEFEIVVSETSLGGGRITENVETLKENIFFSNEEKQQIEYGKDVEIWVEIQDITDSVLNEEKELIHKQLGDSTAAIYLDISVYKKVGEMNAVELNELAEDTVITLKLPDNLINRDNSVVRTYGIIHVHGNETELIVPIFDAQTQTLTFKTDRFSTYTITYTDTPVETTAEDTTPATEETTPTIDETTPTTGDKENITLWITAMVFSVVAMAMIVGFKKRNVTE